MRISILHPSRSRPTQAAATAKSWLSSAKDVESIEYILSVDEYDPSLTQYTEMHVGHECNFTLLISDNNSAIQAINEAAEICKGDLLITISDDFSTPPFHWDVALLEALEGKEDFLVKTQDGCQPWIITLPIMDRKYYDRFGYIYPPHILHMFADTWMTHVGDLLDKIIKLPIVIKHNHYTQRGGQSKDAINEKNDRTWAQGEAEYLKGVRNNFGLKKEDIKGRLKCDSSHVRWLNSKGIDI